MVNKPSTVDEALAYVWELPNTVLEPSEKQSLTAALAEETDAVARTSLLQVQSFGWAR